MDHEGAEWKIAAQVNAAQVNAAQVNAAQVNADPSRAISANVGPEMPVQGMRGLRVSCHNVVVRVASVVPVDHRELGVDSIHRMADLEWVST